MSMNIWEGDRVRLRAVEPGDWEAHFAWNHDSGMSRALDEVWFPQSREGARRWAEQAATRPHGPLGFQAEGRLRRLGFTEGRHFDHLVYGLTADEWRVVSGE